MIDAQSGLEFRREDDGGRRRLRATDGRVEFFLHTAATGAAKAQALDQTEQAGDDDVRKKKKVKKTAKPREGDKEDGETSAPRSSPAAQGDIGEEDADHESGEKDLQNEPDGHVPEDEVRAVSRLPIRYFTDGLSKPEGNGQTPFYDLTDMLGVMKKREAAALKSYLARPTALKKSSPEERSFNSQTCSSGCNSSTTTLSRPMATAAAPCFASPNDSDHDSVNGDRRRSLRTRNPARVPPSGDAPVSDDESSDSHSAYSATNAENEKKIAYDNRIADQLPWLPRVDSVEEEDHALEEEYLLDVAKQKSRRRNKDRGDDQEIDDLGNEDHVDDPEDNVNEHVDDRETRTKTLTARARHGTLRRDHCQRPISRRPWQRGRCIMLCWKAWRVAQRRKFRASSKQWATTPRVRATPSKMTPAEAKSYNAERLAGYRALFDSLSEDERNDPEARRRCVEPVMAWHREKTMQVVDNRKADGKGKALMDKAVAPLIHQASALSTAVSNSLDIEIFGVALDCFGDNAILWGGGSLFQEVFKQHPAPIRKFLTDMKALFQTTSLFLQNQAEATAAGNEAAAMQPVPIVFDKLPGEKSTRDALRRQLGSLFVNQICRAMIERGEEDLETIQKNYTKMPWKWANKAWQHQLRIENWPVALRDTFPGPGFTLALITEKDGDKDGKRARTQAVKLMHEQMKAAYEDPEGDGADEAPRIVSWTPCPNRDLRRFICVVTCRLVEGAPRHLKARKKKRQQKAKASGKKSGAIAGDGAQETPKAKPKPKAKKAKPKVDASSSKPPPVPGRKQLKCRYRNGEFMSDVFCVTELVKYEGTPNNVQRNTLMYMGSPGNGCPCRTGWRMGSSPIRRIQYSKTAATPSKPPAAISAAYSRCFTWQPPHGVGMRIAPRASKVSWVRRSRPVIRPADLLPCAVAHVLGTATLDVDGTPDFGAEVVDIFVGGKRRDDGEGRGVGFEVDVDLSGEVEIRLDIEECLRGVVGGEGATSRRWRQNLAPFKVGYGADKVGACLRHLREQKSSKTVEN
ncbi:hypothetical protein B0H12DRAFT_1075408 [Mycena haematopus]|nr:hypothetical protein B0H12DRAFT_1075408 [Mycena haematopus]